MNPSNYRDAMIVNDRSSKYPEFQFEIWRYQSDVGVRHCERCKSLGTIFSGTNSDVVPEPCNFSNDLIDKSLTKTGDILICPCQDKNLPDHEDTYL